MVHEPGVVDELHEEDVLVTLIIDVVTEVLGERAFERLVIRLPAVDTDLLASGHARLGDRPVVGIGTVELQSAALDDGGDESAADARMGPRLHHQPASEALAVGPVGDVEWEEAAEVVGLRRPVLVVEPLRRRCRVFVAGDAQHLQVGVDASTQAAGDDIGDLGPVHGARFTARLTK